MIALQAAILGGLDEFMLRLGHLSSLCALAAELRGTWARTERELGNALTEFVVVPDELAKPVAAYLKMKRLCAIQGGSAAEPGEDPDYRYPELIVMSDEVGDRLVSEQGDAPKVWWQDLCLASPGVRSRVGAVTIGRSKSGSKTGVSHLTDWAHLLNLATNSGELSAEGHLIASLGRLRVNDHWVQNPYVVGTERLVFAHLLFSSDFDVFSRLVPNLVTQGTPIKRQSGAQVFARTVSEIVDEAENAKYLSGQQVYRITQHLRDLESAGKKGGLDKGIGASSTAWHRAASRLESYVDLGLLEKGRNSTAELYEYVYFPTPALQRASDSLRESSADNGETWLEEHLAHVLFGGTSFVEKLDPQLLLSLIPSATAALNRPASVVPLSPIALAVVWLLKERGIDCSTATARRALEALAREQPEFARLSRGSSGERAEFISFTPKALAR